MAACNTQKYKHAPTSFARGQDSRRWNGDLDETVVEDLLLFPVQLEVLGPAHDGDDEIRHGRIEEFPVIEQQLLHVSHVGSVRESDVFGGLGSPSIQEFDVTVRVRVEFLDR